MGARSSEWILAALASVMVVAGCSDPRPDYAPFTGPSLASDGSALSAQLSFEPEAAASTVEPITRFTLLLDAPLREGRVVLLGGLVTSAQLRDLGRPVLTQALEERLVAATAWASPDGRVITLTPHAPLDPGGVYAVATSAPPRAWPFTVARQGAHRLLQRVWPAEAVARGRVAVWCGERALGVVDQSATFEPASAEGRFQAGTLGPVAVPTCVTWAASSAAAVAPGHPAIAPPSLRLATGEDVALDPTTLLVEDAPAPSGAHAGTPSCADHEIAFNRGCATVEDDRVLVKAPPAAVLWTLAYAGGAQVIRTSPGQRFVVRPFPTDGRVSATTLDASGAAVTVELAMVPAPPRVHVVINEVMANPRGPEPAQEWIELYNDGSSPVALGGYTIEDAHGPAVLPPAQLGAGAFALIVPRAYTPNGQLDAAPPAGTTLIVVDTLALGNDGEPLTLRDPSGDVVSAFPSVKTKNGVSIARRTPDVEDSDVNAFAPSVLASGSSPGAPN